MSLLAACSTRMVQAPIGDRTEKPARVPGQHTVRQGDTLYSVAFLYGYQVEELATWNQLQAPYTIYRGQVLRLTPPAVKVTSTPRPRPPAVAASKPKPRQTVRTAPASTAVPVSPSRPKTAKVAPVKPVQTVKKAPPVVKTSGPLTWAWPVKGPLLQRFRAGDAGKKGIDIGGKSGTPVKAAADGKIVYSGSGLGGYGRLIIIKHNKEFLSAYAHNRKLIATEGQWVKKGQVIALMGSSGTDRTRLHFEIRKRGQPVDPLRYLPR